MNNTQIRKVYCRDFAEFPVYLPLVDGERIVSVGLSSQGEFPVVRVWIEGDDDRVG